jgi:3-oxoacyl-[acyl-carrier protein] reductase
LNQERIMTTNYPTYPDLAGKVAVVTGGSRGIGAATCRLLAANGARIVVNGRDQAAIDQVVYDIQHSGGEAIGVAADCTDFTAVERLRQQTEQAFGMVDVLVIFAGGGIARPGPIQHVTEEEWRSSIDGNLTATFFVIKSFLPGMIERGRGSIVTMASAAARLPSRAPAPYAAAKAGIIMLTRHVANEVGQYGIRINCVSPSAILTERTQQHMSAAQQQQIAAIHPLGRLGVPEDVALTTLFLASASSSWLTGLTIDVAGGRVMV